MIILSEAHYNLDTDDVFAYIPAYLAFTDDMDELKKALERDYECEADITFDRENMIEMSFVMVRQYDDTHEDYDCQVTIQAKKLTPTDYVMRCGKICKVDNISDSGIRTTNGYWCAFAHFGSTWEFVTAPFVQIWKRTYGQDKWVLYDSNTNVDETLNRVNMLNKVMKDEVYAMYWSKSPPSNI